MLSNEWKVAFDAFVEHPRWPFLTDWARESSCLPVYCDWTHALGVRADGAVLSFEHDPPKNRAARCEMVTDLRWINIAIHRGMKDHPWLAAFLPARPANAKVCPTCNGTGAFPKWPKFTCGCGGAGWIP